MQRCNSPAVRRLITFGSQHAGVAAIPQCAPDTVRGQFDFNSLDLDNFIRSLEQEIMPRTKGWCNLMQAVATRGVYAPYVRDHLIQAQYYKDPKQLDNYLKKNIFLPDINNELPQKNERYANNLRTLDRFVMIMFSNDTMVFPKESAWFGFVDQYNAIVPLQKQPLYTEVRIVTTFFL